MDNEPGDATSTSKTHRDNPVELITTPDFCNCIDATNDALKERNMELGVLLDFSGKSEHRVALQAHLIEKRRGQRPGNIVAAYCPFCGRKYKDVR